MHKTYIVVGFIIAITLFMELAAHADAFDKTTKLTFSQAVEVPGQTLSAGTYLFRLADDGGDRNIVQIFNSDGTQLVTTVQTIATQRQQTTDDTEVTLTEPQSGNPAVLVKWFYPGEDIGNEFVYPKQEEKQLAQNQQETFVGSQMLSSSEAAAAGY